MRNTFTNTLTKVNHLRSIIGYNGLVYALKKLPVIGKHLPDKLYSLTALKVIYWIFHIIKEVSMLFIGKIFGLGMIYLAALLLNKGYIGYGMAEGISSPNLYASFALFMFIIYALFGLLINTRLFKCTTEKEYLVFMLRMNARTLNNTLFIFDLGKLVIGYLIAGIVAIIGGAPFWLWLGIPVLAVCIKLFGAGVLAAFYRSKHKHNKLLKGSTWGLIVRLLLVFMLLPVFMVLVINGYYVPLQYMLIIAAVFVLLGIWGFWELSRFDENLHRRALRDNIVRNEIESYKEPDHSKQFKRLKAKGTVKGDKKGFEYLNALFVRRHRTMLVLKAVIFTIVVLLIIALVLFEFIYGYARRFGSDSTWNMLFNNLINFFTGHGYADALHPFDENAATLFFRDCASKQLLLMIIPLSIADISFKSTQAMYINCDNSLMTFSFFKQREKIIRLFDIRLKQLIRINIWPALACGLFAVLILFNTGGQDYPFQYLLTVLVPVLISVINSMTWLTLYYLFQPFTTTVNVKGGAYRVTRIILTFITIIICWITLNTAVLAGVLTVFTVVYVILLRAIVKKYAPKTWKMKS
ncbi:MAG: hypothetical protein IJL19_06135 [Clostridiales bacterium]|nr:hypothetical protein [Clostridiales bacterium]